MGDHPDDPKATTAVLTRLATAASRLGIEVGPLWARLPELGAPTKALVSLGSDPRLAIRCALPADAPPLDRPATARWIELEQGPGGEVARTDAAVGTAPFADDRARLIAAGVPEAACDALGAALARVGEGRCDQLARRVEGAATTWITTVIAPPADAAALTETLAALVEALGVHPAQRALLAQVHPVLAPRGCAVGFAAGARGVQPVLLVEYRDVAWQQAVGLSETLRPVGAAATRLGTFAGAFDAARAAALELAFVPQGVARVRVSVEA